MGSLIHRVRLSQGEFDLEFLKKLALGVFEGHDSLLHLPGVLSDLNDVWIDVGLDLGGGDLETLLAMKIERRWRRDAPGSYQKPWTTRN